MCHCATVASKLAEVGHGMSCRWLGGNGNPNEGNRALTPCTQCIGLCQLAVQHTVQSTHLLHGKWSAQAAERAHAPPYGLHKQLRDAQQLLAEAAMSLQHAAAVFACMHASHYDHTSSHAGMHA